MDDQPVPPKDLPWPRADDDPFKPDDDSPWVLIACLNFSRVEPWYPYAEGFKRLADLGVRHVEQTGRNQDLLVYPIVFAYRHHIELSLKLLIRAARELLDEPGGVPRSHDLGRLWNTAEALLRKVEPGDDETYRNVRGCLDRFHEFDPDSDAFRYPVRKKGDASLPGLQQVDLGHLRDVVDRLSMFFDAASQELSVRLDCKEETHRAYGP